MNDYLKDSPTPDTDSAVSFAPNRFQHEATQGTGPNRRRSAGLPPQAQEQASAETRTSAEASSEQVIYISPF